MRSCDVVQSCDVVMLVMSIMSMQRHLGCWEMWFVVDTCIQCAQMSCDVTPFVV